MFFSNISTDYLYSARIDKLSYKEFQDLNDSKEWGNRIYKQWGLNYNAIEQKMQVVETETYCKAPIESFCGYGYLSENTYLRTNKKAEHYRSLTDILIRVICAAPTIPENIIVYRLVCDEVIKELTTIKNGRSYFYYEKGFMSTSLLKNIVESKEPYSSHKNLLKIYVEKNTIGAYVNVITRGNEEEMLFLPGMTLGLIEKPYKDRSINKIVYECIMWGGKYN